MTDGMKTSEFYLTLLATGLEFLVALGVFTPEQAAEIEGVGSQAILELWDFLVVVLPIVGYSVSRGIAKSGS